MQVPKKNPVNTMPFFFDPEDLYPFETYALQMFRNLAVAQSAQCGVLMQNILAWLLQAWMGYIDASLAKNADGADFVSIEVPVDVARLSLSLLANQRGAKNKTLSEVPMTEELAALLKAHGINPKGTPRVVNLFKDTEIFNTNIPQKERTAPKSSAPVEAVVADTLASPPKEKKKTPKL